MILVQRAGSRQPPLRDDDAPAALRLDAGEVDERQAQRTNEHHPPAPSNAATDSADSCTSTTAPQREARTPFDTLHAAEVARNVGCQNQHPACKSMISPDAHRVLAPHTPPLHPYSPFGRGRACRAGSIMSRRQPRARRRPGILAASWGGGASSGAQASPSRSRLPGLGHDHDPCVAGQEPGEPAVDAAGRFRADRRRQRRQPVAHGCGLVVDDVVDPRGRERFQNHGFAWKIAYFRAWIRVLKPFRVFAWTQLRSP
jgi:hypothetical protein